jgi:hypothetical protein
MSLTIPNTFQNKTGTVLLSELDDNFNYIINNIPEFDTTAQLSLTSLTPSTSKTTGALTISGGVGIGGDLNVGGAVNATQYLRVLSTVPSERSLVIKPAGGLLGGWRIGFADDSDPNGDLTSTAIRLNAIGNTVTIDNIISNLSFKQTTAGKFYVPGTIIQVKTAQTTAARQTISSTNPVLITGLVLPFTPFFEDSRIIIMANISGSHTHVNSYGVYKDSQPTVSTSGHTNNNQPNMHVTQYIGTTTADYMYQVPVVHSEISGSTNTRTYAIYATSGWSNGSYTLYINNRASNDMASFSHMTIFEVCGG